MPSRDPEIRCDYLTEHILLIPAASGYAKEPCSVREERHQKTAEGPGYSGIASIPSHGWVEERLMAMDLLCTDLPSCVISDCKVSILHILL